MTTVDSRGRILDLAPELRLRLKDRYIIGTLAIVCMYDHHDM